MVKKKFTDVEKLISQKLEARGHTRPRNAGKRVFKKINLLTFPDS